MVDNNIIKNTSVEDVDVKVRDTIEVPVLETPVVIEDPEVQLPQAVFHEHPIESIYGLREELDELGKPRTFYSDHLNVANYYKWHGIGGIGYFVSLASMSTEIEICNGKNIFGVTVDSAGFVGSDVDDSIYREDCALVVTSGIVDVLCESDVGVGDSVVSNEYGIATKTTTQCGYTVIAIEDKVSVRYATIALGVQACTTDILGKKLNSLDNRVLDVETDLVATMNAANEAYNKANECATSNKEVVEIVGGMSSVVEDLSVQVSNTVISSEQAKAIANAAAVSAETSRNEAVEAANDALSNVNNLIADLEPISSWGVTDDYITVDTWDNTDKDINKTYYAKDTKLYYFYYNGKWEPISQLSRGAEYLTTYIKNDLATKAEVYTVETMTEENKSSIEKNAASLQSMVSSVDKYSVGEFSQSYGLTHEQAKNILTKGMIYVPTKHSKERSHSETFEDTGEVNYFTPGGYYEWDGNDWIEHSNSVAFFSEEPNPTRILRYWYIDSNDAPEGYQPHALYIWNNGEWQMVNTLAGNANNRLTSMIRQTAEEVALEVVNARGGYAGLSARLEEDNKAQVEMVASVVNKDGTVNTASIVQSVNEDESTIAINADKINFDGLTTFLHSDGVKNGMTIIDGGRVTTGAIQSNNYKYTSDEDEYSDNGTAIDLNTGYIRSKNFAIDKDGNASLRGHIVANSGNIGNLQIHEDGSLITTATAINEEGNEVDLTTFSIGADGNASFAGNIEANSGRVGNLYIGTDGSLTAYGDDGEDVFESFSIGADGNASFNGEINARNGQIGDLIIEDGALKNRSELNMSADSGVFQDEDVYIGLDGIRYGDAMVVNTKNKNPYIMSSKGVFGMFNMDADKLKAGSYVMFDRTNDEQYWKSDTRTILARLAALEQAVRALQGGTSHTHTWVSGICTGCGSVCTHTTCTNNICDTCKMKFDFNVTHPATFTIDYQYTDPNLFEVGYDTDYLNMETDTASEYFEFTTIKAGITSISIHDDMSDTNTIYRVRITSASGGGASPIIKYVGNTWQLSDINPEYVAGACIAVTENKGIISIYVDDSDGSITVHAEKAGEETLTIKTADGEQIMQTIVYTIQAPGSVTPPGGSTDLNGGTKYVGTTWQLISEGEYFKQATFESCSSSIEVVHNDEDNGLVLKAIEADENAYVKISASGATVTWKYVIENCTSHNWYNSICLICGIQCSHPSYSTDNKCIVCGTAKPSGGGTTCTHPTIKSVVTTAATCTTEGVKTYTCDTCQTTWTEAIAELGHDLTVEVKAKAATCTEAGNTAGEKCSRCDHTTVETIPANGHTEQIIQGKPATCTTDGLTEGKKCSVCGDTIVEQKIIKAAHTPQEVPGKPATCTTDGLTAGNVCSVCDTVLAQQSVLPALGHDLSGSEVIAPTCGEWGYTLHKCSRCDYSERDTYVEPTGAHTQGDPYEEGGDQYYCSVCGSLYTPR